MARKMLVLSVAICLPVVNVAKAQTSCFTTWNYNLTNGTTADASQVMGDLNQLLTCTTNILAGTYNLSKLNVTGSVGIGTIAPPNTVSASPVQYSTGTASQSGSTVTGSGTSWTSSMVGSQFVFANGVSAGTITAASATSLTVTTSQTVSSQTYTINYPGLQVTSAGSVGVGTSAPTTALDIYGTNGLPATSGTTQNNMVRVEGSSANVLDIGVSNSSPFGAWLQADARTALGTNYPLLLNPNGGSVGIGTTTPQAKFDVEYDPAITANSSSNYVDSWNQITVNEAYNYTGALWGAIGRGAIYGSQTGSVATIVGVQGDIYHYGPQTVSVAQGVNAVPVNESTGTFTTAQGLNAAVYNAAGGSIGTAEGISAGVFNTGSGSIGTGYGIYLAGIAGTSHFSLYASDSSSPSYFAGRVGVGTTSPQEPLHVNVSSGDVLELQSGSSYCQYTYNVTSGATCLSDMRLKKDIVDTGDALLWLEGMRIRDYTLRESGERMTGVVAQELMTTHPDMVHMDDNGFYAVDTPGVWKLVKAIQELKAENDQLHTRIVALETQKRASISDNARQRSGKGGRTRPGADRLVHSAVER